MSTMSTTAERFTELRAIHYTLTRIADELPDELAGSAVDKLRDDLRYLAKRLDTEIAITPAYTGEGNAAISGMLRGLVDDFYHKFEALADSIDPELIAYEESDEENPDEFSKS